MKNVRFNEVYSIWGVSPKDYHVRVAPIDSTIKKVAICCFGGIAKYADICLRPLSCSLSHFALEAELGQSLTLIPRNKRRERFDLFVKTVAYVGWGSLIAAGIWWALQHKQKRQETDSWVQKFSNWWDGKPAKETSWWDGFFSTSSQESSPQSKAPEPSASFWDGFWPSSKPESPAAANPQPVKPLVKKIVRRPVPSPIEPPVKSSSPIPIRRPITPPHPIQPQVDVAKLKEGIINIQINLPARG